MKRSSKLGFEILLALIFFYPQFVFKPRRLGRGHSDDRRKRAGCDPRPDSRQPLQRTQKLPYRRQVGWEKYHAGGGQSRGKTKYAHRPHHRSG